MPKQLVVANAQAVSAGDPPSPCWIVTFATDDDGRTRQHIFPEAALEWRAAEYGIDPADTDTLLEVVLHEPHMPRTADDTFNKATRFTDGSPALWEAESTTAAREAHLARVAACPVQISVRGARQLDAIRNAHRPDLERIRGMREAVDTNRWTRLYGVLPAQPLKKEPGRAR